MRSTTVAAPDGAPLAVQESGRADGPLLVLLAGQDAPVDHGPRQ